MSRIALLSAMADAFLCSATLSPAYAADTSIPNFHTAIGNAWMNMSDF